MIHFALTAAKRRIMDAYLDEWGEALMGRLQPVTYEEVAKMRSLPRGGWVLSDLDALGPAGTALAEELHDTLRAASLPVLNDPRRVLHRVELLEELHRRGINDFRVARATEAWRSLRFPVFVRGASDHLGSLGGLLHDTAAVEETLERAERLGLPAGDLIVVEFEDTAGRDGLYRKHGTFVVGDRIAPQHVLWSEDWMIKHARSVFTAANAREEYDLVRSDEHEEALREVFRIAGVEYGRVDYSVGRDGRIQVWEINLCPIVTSGPPDSDDRNPPELTRLRRPRREHAFGRLREAWERFDPEEETTPRVSFDPPASVRERTLEELAPRTGPEDLLHLLRSKAHFRYW